MNAPLHSALLAGMIDTRRPRRRNRRRRSAFRASVRRVTIAAAIASAATLAALAASAVSAGISACRERSVAQVCRYLHTGEGPLTVGALGSVPRDLEKRAWITWSKRLAADLAKRRAASAPF